MHYNYNKYIYIFLFLLIITGILFYTNSKVAIAKIENIKNEKYKLRASSIQDRIQTLINDKQNSTLSIALVLAEDSVIKNVLQNKQSDDLKRLSQNSLKLRKHSDFKNVWFQILDTQGVSLFRSWVRKRGDSVLKARLDVAEMIQKPQIMSTISTGKFDMTFKSMVPIYNEQNQFIGIIEVITHFNSIAKRLIKSGIEPVILVDKRYKQQITKPFTKLFIDDYYVANYNAKPELMQYIKNKGVESFANQSEYKLMDNYFISFYHLPDIKNLPMGHFVFFQNIDSIDITEIESFKLVSKIIILTLLGFFIFGVFLILFLARKNQVEILNQSLENNNKKLERIVQEKVEENKQQNLLLQKKNRLVALGEMLENIAHQWRQPLSAISTSASGLKIRYDFDDSLTKEEIFEHLDVIINSSQYLSMTIDDFRNFFKKDGEKEEFNVAQSIQHTYSILKALYQTKQIEIIFDLEEDILYTGYKREFTQVIINLLNNAKDALVANETLKEKLVFVTLKKEPHFIKISIEDNAGGVPEKIAEKIFDPYFTTKHQSQGTGIGLYMCQEIIIDHFNGSIYHQNTTRQYNEHNYTCADFIIKLPL